MMFGGRAIRDTTTLIMINEAPGFACLSCITHYHAIWRTVERDRDHRCDSLTADAVYSGDLQKARKLLAPCPMTTEAPHTVTGVRHIARQTTGWTRPQSTPAVPFCPGDGCSRRFCSVLLPREPSAITGLRNRLRRKTGHLRHRPHRLSRPDQTGTRRQTPIRSSAPCPNRQRLQHRNKAETIAEE